MGRRCPFPRGGCPSFFRFPSQGVSPIRIGQGLPSGRKSLHAPCGGGTRRRTAGAFPSGMRFAGEEVVQSAQENVSHALSLSFACSCKTSLREKTAIDILKTPRRVGNPRFFDKPVQDCRVAAFIAPFALGKEGAFSIARAENEVYFLLPPRPRIPPHQRLESVNRKG